MADRNGRAIGRSFGLCGVCVVVGVATIAASASVSRGQSAQDDYHPPSVDRGKLEAEHDAAERAYKAAEAAQARAVHGVFEAEKRAGEANRRLREANAAVDAYLGQLEAAGPSPARREAVRAVEEARVEAERQRAMAVKPLRDDPMYRKWRRELGEYRAWFEKLDERRRRADFIGASMDEQDRADLVKLAQKIQSLDANVYERELSVLDEYEGYREAAARLVETKKVARETVAWLRDLDEADPSRKAMIGTVTDANADAEAADKAVDEARRQRAASNQRMAMAKAELARAAERKSYADRGLAPPTRGD